jgi:hypothetical protein
MEQPILEPLNLDPSPEVCRIQSMAHANTKNTIQGTRGTDTVSPNTQILEYYRLMRLKSERKEVPTK